MATFERRSFLLGALGGIGVGGAAGIGSEEFGRSGRYAHGSLDETQGYAQQSFAQEGEDLILENVFAFLDVRRPTYIDIGAHRPILGNNTYLFYRKGSRGVLVEPNPLLTPELRKVRPGDAVLEIGIGARAEDEEVDYYVIDGDGQANTFSEAQVRKLRAANYVVKSVIKRTLVNVNKVLSERFPAGAPDLFSTDTEGYDLTILRSLDFERFRPKAFCIETLAGLEVDEAIVDHMRSKDYEVRGGTFVNTIFVDARYRRALEKRRGD
jgi:hypothetical protein